MAQTRGEHSATMHRTRSPLTLGWEAARANALPALIIQALMLMLLVAFTQVTRRSRFFRNWPS